MTVNYIILRDMRSHLQVHSRIQLCSKCYCVALKDSARTYICHNAHSVAVCVFYSFTLTG